MVIQLSAEKFIKNLFEKYTPIKLKHNKEQSHNDFDVIINNKDMFHKILTRGEIGLAESYIDGDWDTENLEKMLSLLMLKRNDLTSAVKKQSINFLSMELIALIKSKLPMNTIKSSKKNISFHYDIGNDLYERMLGKHMLYTCAYFHKNDMTLDEAQYAKMELIAKKLDLKPGMKVLDIGCGYGSVAHHLAKNYGVNVIGVTLSKEQKKYSDEKFGHPNVHIELNDYRLLSEEQKFDRIYSVGILEHIGRKSYHEYYNKCYRLLKKNGIMLIHTEGTHFRKWNHNNFVNKYLFPEGEIAHLSNLTGKFVDQWHLEDLQNFGISYAKTLRSWRKNIGNWDGLSNYDNTFKRMWDFYLHGCAAVFQVRDTFLWQLVYTKRTSDRLDDCHYIRREHAAML